MAGFKGTQQGARMTADKLQVQCHCSTPQYTANQGHASQSHITRLLPPDVANNHILYGCWLCCKWQSKASRDILGLIILNSIQSYNESKTGEWSGYARVCVRYSSSQRQGTALHTFPELWLQCQGKISSSQLMMSWRRIISQPAGFHKENLK